ncbi:MAG: sialate O-acetylesterase [Kiritimatiellia bacterium]
MTFGIAGHASRADVNCQIDSPVPHEVFQRQSPTSGVIRVSGAAASGAVGVRVDAGDWQPVTVQPGDGRFSAGLAVAAKGWHRVEFRLPDGAVRRIEPVGVGDVFIVAGQSNAGNYGSERQRSESGMVSSFDGKAWQPCQDPQPGAGGNGGSFLPALGDALATAYGVPIGFAACASGGTSVRQWLPEGAEMTQQPTTGTLVRPVRPGVWASNGQLFAALERHLLHFGTNGVRAVLWHQGESDAGQARAGYPADRQISGEQYRVFMDQLIGASRERAGWRVPWIVALATYHSESDAADDEFRAAQRSLWKADLACEGPDSDALRGDLRDGVHFNAKGLREHGRRWAEKILLLYPGSTP